MKTWEERFTDSIASGEFETDEIVEELGLTNWDKVYEFIASEIKKAYQEGFNDGDTKRQLSEKL